MSCAIDSDSFAMTAGGVNDTSTASANSCSFEPKYLFTIIAVTPASLGDLAYADAVVAGSGEVPDRRVEDGFAGGGRVARPVLGRRHASTLGNRTR